MIMIMTHCIIVERLGKVSRIKFASKFVKICKALMKDKNIFITGGYNYSLTLGGTTLTPPFGNDGIYLAKYNQAGILQWAPLE